MEVPLIPDNKVWSQFDSSERSFDIPSQQTSHFILNVISTSKYNFLTFLPKNLWSQFHKLANIYFLVVAFFQCLPEISVSDGIPNILLPLAIVLLVSGAKDLLEDYRRKISDKTENMKICDVRINKEWGKVKWKDLKVGSIIKVYQDEYFPADILLLNCSESSGMCYIETKNLDGETSLKHKVSNKQTQTYFENDAKLDNLIATIRCECPNPMIYQFRGVFKLENSEITMSPNQMLLRGSSLKNTDYIIGIVVYTGHETKIMLNSPKSKNKYSKLEAEMNRQVLYIFFLQLIICLFAAIYNVLWFSRTKSDTEVYLELEKDDNNTVTYFIVGFFSWMLIFTSFVPISLLVTIEMVKFFQAIFITWDLNLYYEPTDTSAKVQSSNLNEELGQITHILSDKTGTLTCNIMEFRKFSLNGNSYGTSQRMVIGEKIPHVDFCDPNFSSESEDAQQFFTILACCHTVIAQEKFGTIEYQASSPDELALCSAAKYFGYEYLGEDADDHIIIRVKDKLEKYQVLNILEFTSDRKRMSILVRCPDNSIKLFCKGADSALSSLMRFSNILDKTTAHVEAFALEGLRTLVVAYKNISEHDYMTWNEKYMAALTEIHKRDILIDELSDQIEKNLILLGATAIEDKLQDKVSQTILEFKKAGLKIWMLTGDKLETAINIGYSCSLISDLMVTIILQETSHASIKTELVAALDSIKTDVSTKYAFVIQGDSLIYASSIDLKCYLIEIIEKSEVVLACRVSPQQKADIVKLLKDERPKFRILCIGDGANDVSMIATAHLGVGIAGLEGQQAVRASDFAVAQFSYLKNLMFVHGRECYRRNAMLISYNFYKNVLLVIPIWFYGFFSAYSGQLLYNQWTYQMFNTIYAVLPIVVFAVFDKEFDYEILLNTPKLYSIGLKSEIFNTFVFWKWIVEAVLQGLVICLISIMSICQTSGHPYSGIMDNIWVASSLILGIVVIIVNIKIYFISNSHYWFSIFTIITSILSYFLFSALLTEWLIIENWLDNYDSKGSTYFMLTNLNSYVVTLIGIWICFSLKPVLNAIIELKIKLNRNKEYNYLRIDSKITDSSKIEILSNPCMEQINQHL